MFDRLLATRYVTPLREGGSLPGLVEADDLGTYVLKFHGAGQGPKALVAEVIVGELGRLLGIRVPRLVAIELPSAIALYEADEEVQDLLNASPGLNLGVDFLPGAFGYDGSRQAREVDAERIVWLDSFTANVDRTWANPNLLLWHGEVYAIDHGAALWFQHAWPGRAPDAGRFAAQPFDLGTHVLADLARSAGRAVHEEAVATLTPERVREIVALVPQEWLQRTDWLSDAAAVRQAYVDHLMARLERPAAWLGGGTR